jgi:phage terminase large subunit
VISSKTKRATGRFAKSKGSASTTPRPAQRIELGYRPRKQFQAFHARKQRWACLVAHRRCGKTVACVMDLVDAALRCDKPDGRFAYLAPTYAQAKDASWTYLKRFTADIPGIEQRDSDLMVNFPNGARVRLYGAEFYDRLRGTYADGLILDEYADINPRAWPEVLRPSLADRNGWAVFIGTPKGRNDFYRLHQHAEQDPSWFSLILKASETKLLPEHELDDMRSMLTPEQYEQELECSFDAAILGAYYARDLADAEREGRITSVPYDPAISVHTAWDLGVADSTAIWWFQIVRDEVHVIDYYEANGYNVAHYAAVLASKPYAYGREYLPHDAMAREMGTGRSIFETLKAQTNRHPFLVPKLSVMDGINAGRLTLAKAWFDAERCHDGLEMLRAYRADYDERAKVFHDRPRHDFSSHGSDAWRYLSLAWREMQPEKPKPPVKDSWAYSFERAGREEDVDTWRIS